MAEIIIPGGHRCIDTRGHRWVSAQDKADLSHVRCNRGCGLHMRESTAPPDARKALVAKAVAELGHRDEANPIQDYGEARKRAQEMADLTGREVALRRVCWYGKIRGYVVGHVPAVGKRFGSELRAEIVAPGRGR